MNEPSISISRIELNKILTENTRLRAQVDELHKHSTSMVNTQLSRQVRAFHEKYGHPTRSTPCVPTTKEVQFRLKLIAEEFFELLRASIPSKTVPDPMFDIEVLVGNILLREIAVDLPEFIDALADLSYVIEGTAAAMGVDMAPVFAEVQRANMSKEPNGPDAKPVKRADWTPPDIEGVLVRQGWRRKVLNANPVYTCPCGTPGCPTGPECFGGSDFLNGH